MTEPVDQLEQVAQELLNEAESDEPMTGAQASYLKTLREQVHLPDEFDENFTKAEASEKIEEIKALLGK